MFTYIAYAPGCYDCTLKPALPYLLVSVGPMSLPPPPLRQPTSDEFIVSEDLPSYSDTLRSGPSRYACLMLSGTDRIQAISFPYNRRMRDLLVTALRAGEGVANVDLPEDDVWDFKLYGTPCKLSRPASLHAPACG